MSNSITAIRDKYLHDVTYISDYVQYLETFFLASIRMINNLKRVTPTLFVNPIIPTICENNTTIRREMDEYLYCLKTEMQSLNITEKNPNDPCYDDPTPEGDVILSLMTEIHKGEHNPEKLFQNAQTCIMAMCMMKGECEGFEGYYLLNDNPRRVRKLVDIAIEEEKRRRHNSLSAEHSYISMSAKSLELFDSVNQINLYKQNFIQTMAYFDSCIFDMIRSCMEQNFFKWLSYFDSVNIKTHDMADCGNFDSFKATQIETFLKKCYVKDLLNILHDKFNGIFIINGANVYPTLQEMIGRRNVHIHHNGIVDSMYLSKFNLYGASVGDYLKIDRNYYNDAIELTKQVVISIATNCV